MTPPLTLAAACEGGDGDGEGEGVARDWYTYLMGHCGGLGLARYHILVNAVHLPDLEKIMMSSKTQPHGD
jgi:hypothetical protein